MTVRIYLAGPEVFLANAHEIGMRKCTVCMQYGLTGIFPAEEEERCSPALTLPERGLAISRAMERVMRTCDAMNVNLTPFRGPSADVGSAYEMGFMRALGRPIFAYTNDDRPTLTHPNPIQQARQTGRIGRSPISRPSTRKRQWPRFSGTDPASGQRIRR